jgi:hypothetical protein
MKVITIKQIDGIEIIDSIQDAKYFIDPEKTMQVINKKGIVLENKTIEERRKIFHDNAVYFGLAQNMEYIEDKKEIEKLEFLLGSRRPGDLLKKADKLVVPNHSGKTFFRRENNKWIEDKVLKFDQVIPANAVFAENLTKEQQLEISEQKERQRIAGLSEKEREEEKQQIMETHLNSVMKYKLQLELEEVEENEVKTRIKKLYDRLKAETNEKYDIGE